ncbi:hypothetical protein MUP01_04145 [Candidatus Bathyarchaeota archaeon]|nr:hypothetical protein [Candidatus Bathyarchaeota archaeon]
MSTLYLLDATATETNAIKLRFLNTEGKIKEVIDEEYKPYFLVEHPLTAEEQRTVEYFSGALQTVEKTDVFTGGKKSLGRISWPSVSIATKVAKRFRYPRETEIDFPKSYVYDRGLAFGALHSASDLKPVLETLPALREKFEKIFKETQSEDPVKNAQILYWFSLLSQPIPDLDPSFLGASGADKERIYTAWCLSRVANLPLTETLTSRHVSDWLKSIIYTHFRKNNLLIPTAEELTRGKPTHRVVGALTVSPIPGIYFNTVICDFESLYASCIDSFNLSYETVDCEHSNCIENKIPDFEGHVCTQRRGFYAILIGALKELRIKLFKPASKDATLTEEERRIATATSKLLKLILVSSYGVTVRIHGLACPPLAEAITGYGRYILRESWKMAEQEGLRPLYGDTDSLFLDKASEEQVAWLIGAVREKFDLYLAVDKRYRLCVLPKAKKAYFGILLDGTPDIKGVTAAKSNSSGYTARVFRQCVEELSTVRSQEEYLQAKQRIKEVVRKALADLRGKRIQMEDLTYSARLYFDPNEKAQNIKTAHQPYQCALQLINMGKELKRGDTVTFIKVKPFKYNRKTFTVKPAEFVKNLAEVNIDDYVRNLLTALNQTFEPMDIRLETSKETEISKWLT